MAKKAKKADKAKPKAKPVKLAGKKQKVKKLSPEEIMLSGTTVPKKSLAWEVIKVVGSVIIDRPASEFYILVISADDQKTITEFRNTGKAIGEVYYADQKLPGVQGDEVILVLRK